LLWARFAAFLSFVAVLSALLAPVSMLAQDVQSGKLGGVCSLNNFAAASSSVDGAAAGSSSAQPKGAHCDLCGSLGLALPVLALLVIPSFPGSQVVVFTLPPDPAASVPGLPPGRGPPTV
jgi:hypothetical protein